MNTLLYQNHQQNHDSVGLNPGGSCPSQRAMSQGMAFCPGSGQHPQATPELPRPLMIVPLPAYPPGAHMHGIYAFQVMVPAQLQPQAALTYTWANPYSRWTEPQPVEILQQTMYHPGKTLYNPYSNSDQLKPSCPVDHVGPGSKPIQSNGQAEELGHLMPKNTSQGLQLDDQEAPVNIESVLGCGRDFAKTLSKVMTKTSDRLMALLQEELDRLDKLDAENESICEVQDGKSTPGIKPEGKPEENDELKSPATKGDKPGEERPMLDEAGSPPQASDEPITLDQVTMTGKLGAMKTVAARRLCSSDLRADANLGRQTGTGFDDPNDLDSDKGPGLEGPGRDASV